MVFVYGVPSSRVWNFFFRPRRGDYSFHGDFHNLCCRELTVSTAYPNTSCAAHDFVIRDRFHRRAEVSKFIQRYLCEGCGRRFSSSTFSEQCWQGKRRLYFALLKIFASCNSVRLSAILVGVDRKTAARKFIFSGKKCRRRTRKNSGRSKEKSTMCSSTTSSLRRTPNSNLFRCLSLSMKKRGSS